MHLTQLVPRAVAGPVWLTALAVLFNLGSVASGVEPPSIAASTLTSAVSPRPSTPLATATPAATAPSSAAPLDPATTVWTRIGGIPKMADGTVITDIVGFSGGYVGLGDVPGAGPAAWFSPDGLRWSATPLMRLATNCPGWGPKGADMVWDGVTRAIATDGNRIVIVGEILDYEGAVCGTVHPASWTSSDGRIWVRSGPWEDGQRAVHVWAVPGGWQADTGTTIWASVDGLAWHVLADIPWTIGTAASASGGTVLATGSPVDGDGSQAIVSLDGQTWSTVAVPDSCMGATAILPPSDAGLNAWVLVGDLHVCTSPDVSTWTDTALAVAFYGGAQTRYGAILLGDACYGAGVTCHPDLRAYGAVNDTGWTALHPMPVASWSLADGPAGVLFLGSDPKKAGAIGVWRLDSR